jgi:putative copper export protein
MAFVPAHYLHLVLAAVWLGFLVGALAVSRLGAARVVEYHRAFGPIALASLLLAGALGLYLATFFGGPGDWFRFGTFTGRIGEKMISFLVLLALGGYIQHVQVKRLRERGDSALRGYRVAVGFTMLATLATMLLGTMIAKGV